MNQLEKEQKILQYEEKIKDIKYKKIRKQNLDKGRAAKKGDGHRVDQCEREIVRLRYKISEYEAKIADLRK